MDDPKGGNRVRVGRVGSDGVWLSRHGESHFYRGGAALADGDR